MNSRQFLLVICTRQFSCFTDEQIGGILCGPTPETELTGFAACPHWNQEDHNLETHHRGSERAVLSWAKTSITLLLSYLCVLGQTASISHTVR